MLIKDPVSPIRTIESEDELSEARLEAVGFIYHGAVKGPDGKRGKAGANLLHFAKCPKIERAAVHEAKIWFRSIRIAKGHLDEVVGTARWRWCKVCEREITQRIINEP